MLSTDNYRLLHLSFQAETCRVCVNIFYITRNKISTKIFPIDPYYKIPLILWRHVSRHVSTKVGDFYNRGLWGIFSFFVGSSWIFIPDYIKITLTHVMNVSVRKKSNKKVITKMSLTNLYEMNISLWPWYSGNTMMQGKYDNNCRDLIETGKWDNWKHQHTLYMGVFLNINI